MPPFNWPVKFCEGLGQLPGATRVALAGGGHRLVRARDRGDLALAFRVDLEGSGVVCPRDHDRREAGIGLVRVQRAHPVGGGRSDGQRGCGEKKHEDKVTARSRRSLCETGVYK